ncbi:MAG: shikimate kinase [Candidatus Kappaea frigidicola]|nr:shikimate kinase [Candidatus Kappaea frigidicola]
MNLYLVGFMGSGKTAVAKEIAESTDLKYIEMDELIEKKEARSINDIFKDSGEDYFRKVEKEALKEISLADNQVVSCGGGVVIDEANVNLMKDSGVLICLQASPDVIYKRVKNNKDRPLLNVENPQVKIEELLRIRRPYYQKANYIIETDNLSVQQVAQEVKSIFLK